VSGRGLGSGQQDTRSAYALGLVELAGLP